MTFSIWAKRYPKDLACPHERYHSLCYSLPFLFRVPLRLKQEQVE